MRHSSIEERDLGAQLIVNRKANNSSVRKHKKSLNLQSNNGRTFSVNFRRCISKANSIFTSVKKAKYVFGKKSETFEKDHREIVRSHK